MKATAGIAVAALCWLGTATVTAAPAPSPASAPKPWAAGVSDAEQSRALEIYRQGNAEFEEARYAQALAMYRDAIKHWDHPAIRFNMVVCLINLDQPLEAYDDLEAALHYGETPLGADVYAQGLTYKKLLLGELARLQVTSTEHDADISLDGTRLFVAPGNVTKLVKPGTHQLVATKPGSVTATIPLRLIGGELAVRDIRLERETETTVVRRWSPWKPWLVVGAGAAAAAAGGVLEWRSYEHYQTYDANPAFRTSSPAGICARGCGGPSEPALPSSLASEQHRAHLENELAISLFAVGGAALVVGAIGVYLDAPHAVRGVTVSPTIGDGTAALVVGGAF